MIVLQHDETLAKVLRGEMQSFGHGFSPVPFNRRKVKNHTAAAQLFRNRFRLQLNQVPSGDMDREQTLRLCRGQELRVRLFGNYFCRFYCIGLVSMGQIVSLAEPKIVNIFRFIAYVSSV
jgi:hypothetical protein